MTDEQIKNIEKANELVEKERSGIPLTDEEKRFIILTHWGTEEEIIVMNAVTDPGYRKPDKDGIKSII